jgi:Cof subfamily protein (haloacid dehalogenase superfamily)
MTEFRIAAIDIDDTLLGEDAAISRANAIAVSHLVDRGIQVVLASGRSFRNMLPFHRALGLRGPVISSHGAVVRHSETGELWYENCVAAEVTSELIAEGRRRGVGIICYAGDEIYIERRTEWTQFDDARNSQRQILVEDLDRVTGAHVHKVMWVGDPDMIAALAPEAAERFGSRATVTPTDPPYLEITALNTSKAAGVAVVADRLGVPAQAVVAFGDGNNDVPMLEWAGLGVAVGHARDSAKAVADLVGPEGDADTALARAIAVVLSRPGDGRRAG